jgi:hypothetical protein
MTEEMHPPPPPPDFQSWSTYQLQYFLPDYVSNVVFMERRHGATHPETAMFRDWVRAIQSELEKRIK